MSNRSRELKLLKTTEENGYIVVKLRYDIGGMNYFTGEQSGRGYYLSVSPETRENGCTSFVLFSGIRSLVEKSQRFNERRFNEITVTDEQINKLVLHVLNKNRLTLAEAVAA